MLFILTFNQQYFVLLTTREARMVSPRRLLKNRISILLNINNPMLLSTTTYRSIIFLAIPSFRKYSHCPPTPFYLFPCVAEDSFRVTCFKDQLLVSAHLTASSSHANFFNWMLYLAGGCPQENWRCNHLHR